MFKFLWTLGQIFISVLFGYLCYINFSGEFTPQVIIFGLLSYVSAREVRKLVK